jgi:hypothetical protein
MSSLTLVQNAESVANSQEKSIIEQLNSAGTKNGVFVTKNDIPESSEDQLIQASMNAHMSKVQSTQLSEKTIAKVTELEAWARSVFIGTKVTIKKLNSKSDCIDAVIFNKQTGEYRTSVYNKSTVKGYINDIQLNKNLLVISPTMTAKFINPNRHLFYVYVVNTQNLTSEITIS